LGQTICTRQILPTCIGSKTVFRRSGGLSFGGTGKRTNKTNEIENGAARAAPSRPGFKPPAGPNPALDRDGYQVRSLRSCFLVTKTCFHGSSRQAKAAASRRLKLRRPSGGYFATESVAAIAGLRGLKYVKSQDKVLPVRPSTGIVVDEVAM